MKKIVLDLSALIDGVERLKDLKEKVKDNKITIPDVQGSGETADAIYALAETFKSLEDIWEVLIEESVHFFESMEQTHEQEQLDLATAIKGVFNK